MTKREKALKLTVGELSEIKKHGGLSAVAQVLGISGRGSPDELMRRIMQVQKKENASG
jgi:hypothetical protein